MSDATDYLNEIEQALRQGKRQWRRGNNLLWAFGYVRRRQTAIDQINRELAARGIVTNPPIGPEMPLDGYISFALADRAGSVPGPDEIEPPAGAGADESVLDDVPGPSELSISVANLEAAERAPLAVAPDATVSEALTRMDFYQHSQLVVQTTPHSVRGTISYRSIARAQLFGSPQYVRECLDDPPVPRVKLDDPLLRVVDYFRSHHAVLVFGPDQAIRGIVTPADIAAEFGGMAGPFLLAGEIESLLRWLVRRKVDLPAAAEAVGLTNGHEGVEFLGLGDIQRILEHEDHWRQLGIPYDRRTFCRELSEVRSHRNAVMHFREPLRPDQFRQMQGFVDVLKRVCESMS